MDAVTRTIQGRKRGSMSKRELIRFLKEEIPKLPTNYDRVYDAVTLDEGISDCIDVGRRQAYELILNKLEGMTYGFCVYHGIECDYEGDCIDCPHNTEEDIEWFKQDEERAESEDNDKK